VKRALVIVVGLILVLTACGKVKSAPEHITPITPASVALTPAPPSPAVVQSDAAPATTAPNPPLAPAPSTPAVGTGAGTLPNSALTPGAIDPAITQANIGTTICRPGGGGDPVRPPESYTESLKEEQLDNGYAVNVDTRLGDYEEDHLIPLELGGSPTSTLNLWPEEHPSSYTKDGVESDLNHAVCDGRVKLAPAQQAIAQNWKTAEQTLGLS
jgi:hypothetical protein